MQNFRLSEKEQNRIWKETRISAGPRYTKDINVELPIKELFEGIGRTDEFFQEIERLKKELVDSFQLINFKKISTYQDKIVKRNLTRIHDLGEEFIKIVNVLGKDRTKVLDLKNITKKATKILKYFLPIDKIIWETERKEDDEARQKAKEEKKEYFGHSQSDTLRNLKDLEYGLNKFERSIRKIEDFSRSHKAMLANEPFLLILGQAGMGKTHLVCDITKSRIDKKLGPTIIILGEKLLSIKKPLESIFKACSLKERNSKILKGLNEISRRKKMRSLIIVDAINEADREGWKSGVRNLVKQIGKYPWIGLVMTCRTPFQFLSLPKRFQIITEYHHGFEENELEAMTEFFNFYGIPLPEIPLLISEFSNPLFLSCFCKTARNIKDGKAGVAQNIKDLALGQAGMTKILEDFYVAKEEQTVKKHNAQFKSLIKQSWIWSKKGKNKNFCLVKLIAKKMADTGRRYLSQSEVISILKQLSNNQYQESACLRVLNILLEEGMLVRDAAWDDQAKQYFEVIKFSFHKFSDHIIARYLLDNFFDSKKVKESLSGQNALGRLFQDEKSVISNIDIIEALMVEFPERIKKNPKLHEKDLIDFLPKEIISSPQIRSAVIESLYWRKPENFLNNKKIIKKSVINFINKTLLQYDNSSREFLDLFVSTATKPFHPLAAKRLSDYLGRFAVSGRDLFWSEYLRKQYGAGSVYKLISWIENQNLEKITPEQARCVITTLGWVLTTNVRLLRNRATRCIYIIGKIRPEECFKVTLELSKANDPYIAERMLAASYGVAMALHTTRNNDDFLKILLQFAKNVYSLFFRINAPYGTTNILIRDYARGIIEVALLHNKNLLSPAKVKRIQPPYINGGIRRWGRSKDRDSGKYRDGNAPLGMDFKNYTLGHLVSNRRNYDFKNKGFITIKENILWRIYQLGYSLEKFGGIDKLIVSNSRIDRKSDYADKVDRYGKKYSWIAYYELLGLKADKNELDSWWVSEEGRNIEFNIDPSFPQTSYQKRGPLVSENLTKGPRKIKEWLVQFNAPDISSYLKLNDINGVAGPWILVHGTIGQNSTKLSRRITTFISGFLVDDRFNKKLREFLNGTEFPGNDNIPSLPEVRDIFAGELGWREKPEKNNILYLKIKRGEKKIKFTEREKKFFNARIIINGLSGSETSKQKKPQEYKIVPIYEKIPVEPLARWFSSKDYSNLGKDNDGVGLYIPSRKIIKENKLHPGISCFNLLDLNDKVASISFVRGEQYGTHENLLYLREDLFNKIIKKSHKKLFLLTWGERMFWPETGFEHREDLSPIYQSYKNVYKKIIKYKN